VMKTLDLLIKESCHKFSSKAAVRCKVAGSWQETTYRTLWRDAERIASGLQIWGLGEGERVALLGPNSPRWMSIYLGIIHAGGIVVPVDKELKSGELRHVLADCGARVLFSEKSHLDAIAEIGSELSGLEKIVLIHGPADQTESQDLHQMMAALAEEWHRLSAKFNIPTEETSRLESLGRKLEGYLLEG
jgi:long-chain acyl-CoA synthetase